MQSSDELFRSLREALAQSPDNVPLRRHLAEQLLQHDRPEEAEIEFREALAREPDDAALKQGLAAAFLDQGKQSHAMVIIEDLVSGKHPPAAALLLHARLLLDDGDVPLAVAQYKLATDADPAVADEALAEQLGIGAKYEESEVVDGRLRIGDGEGQGPSQFEIERSNINFSDVGGMESLKDEIRIKIIDPLDHRELFEAYGKTVGGGILMYGPPGCGKTLMARATAGEISAGFISVGISDVLDMWIGSSEKQLHALFDHVR